MDEDLILNAQADTTPPEEFKPIPKKNCKWCYGRGYIGIETKTKAEIVCPCIIKQVEKYAKNHRPKIEIK